jgi:hypothetical protein
VLTIFFVFILPIRVSYKPNKYSDFGKTKNYSDFQKMRYTKYMAILDNVDNDQYPLFESESSAGEIKLFSGCCSNGCACQTQADHNTEFVQDIIDFEQ